MNSEILIASIIAFAFYTFITILIYDWLGLSTSEEKLKEAQKELLTASERIHLQSEQISKLSAYLDTAKKTSFDILKFAQDLSELHTTKLGPVPIERIYMKLAEEAGEVCGVGVRRSEKKDNRGWKAELEDELGDLFLVLLVLAAKENQDLLRCVKIAEEKFRNKIYDTEFTRKKQAELLESEKLPLRCTCRTDGNHGVISTGCPQHDANALTKQKLRVSFNFGPNAKSLADNTRKLKEEIGEFTNDENNHETN